MKIELIEKQNHFIKMLHYFYNLTVMKKFKN